MAKLRPNKWAHSLKATWLSVCGSNHASFGNLHWNDNLSNSNCVCSRLIESIDLPAFTHYVRGHPSSRALSRCVSLDWCLSSIWASAAHSNAHFMTNRHSIRDNCVSLCTVNVLVKLTDAMNGKSMSISAKVVIPAAFFPSPPFYPFSNVHPFCRISLPVVRVVSLSLVSGDDCQ